MTMDSTFVIYVYKRGDMSRIDVVLGGKKVEKADMAW
jgi:hypothetical protein